MHISELDKEYHSLIKGALDAGLNWLAVWERANGTKCIHGVGSVESDLVAYNRSQYTIIKATDIEH